MTASKQRDGTFQHPGEAALRNNIDRSRQLRAETLERGASVFIGYIRSHAKTKTESSKDQETWTPEFPPSAA